MQVKKAIVLAAGKGTRMGPLGERLAKPMWPFFGLSLLELQLLFLRKNFGVQKIYLNSHHLHEQLEPLNSENVTVIYEPELLDQGGGILNICQKFDLWDEPLIVNNADQLYFFKKEYFEKASYEVEVNGKVLFGLRVSKGAGYNMLLTDLNKNLVRIEKNKDVSLDAFSTYSGLALLKIEKQDYDKKPISFFESVARFDTEKVLINEIESGEYYDFGKIGEYYDLCFSTKKLLDAGETNSLIELLKSSDQFSYRKEKGLNFSSDLSRCPQDGEILLDEGKISSKNGILETN